MSRNITFKTGNYYYIYNSGRGGQDVFYDKWDYARFVFSLMYFNTKNSVGKLGNTRHYMKPNYRGTASVVKNKGKLVNILLFSLIPCSYHLVMQQIEDRGVSRFMQKLGTGYTGYLKSKRDIGGSVFRGPYKAREATKQDLLELSRFIHMIPAKKLLNDSGETESLRDKTYDFIENYPWSSYPHYIDLIKLPFVDKNNIGGLLLEPESYRLYIRS